MDYKNKYIEYKMKYLELKNSMIGGGFTAQHKKMAQEIQNNKVDIQFIEHKQDKPCDFCHVPQDSKPLICEYIPYILSGGNIHYKPIHSIPSNNLDDNEIKNELFLLYQILKYCITNNTKPEPKRIKFSTFSSDKQTHYDMLSYNIGGKVIRIKAFNQAHYHSTSHTLSKKPSLKLSSNYPPPYSEKRSA